MTLPLRRLLKYPHRNPLIRFSLPNKESPVLENTIIPFYSHSLLTPITEMEIESLLCGGFVPE